MTPPPIETSTPQERREWIRREFPCISCCENCGLCQVYHGMQPGWDDGGKLRDY